VITREILKHLISLPVSELNKIVQNSGELLDANFTAARFVGINQNGKFVYKVMFEEDGETQQGRIFVSYDHDKNVINAEF
jgi:hypothetical protein